LVTFTLGGGAGAVGVAVLGAMQAFYRLGLSRDTPL
jgi:hypothetical protein